jgi:thiamine kinase-like enzyme
MTFLLSTDNVLSYLETHQISVDQSIQEIQAISCKNFNLAIQLEKQHLLVKQECHNAEGKHRGEVAHEWYIHQFLDTFPEVVELRSLLPEILHFDAESAILVSQFFPGYCDLDEWYEPNDESSTAYDPAIAQALGLTLAQLHRTTFQAAAYRDFFSERDAHILRSPRILRNPIRLKPEIFGQINQDGLEFYRLYQRYDSLQTAIVELGQTWNPCCLVHHDLKLNNILIRRNWANDLTQPFQTGDLRLIDWEKFLWGDPAFDVATVLASYLKRWLGSLMVSAELGLETALRMATMPLETLQPSLLAFIQTYLRNFPEIVAQNPHFLRRTMQMTGVCLIQRIQAKLDYLEPFGNSGICMLQVAKSLLCQPEESIPAIFNISDL